MKKSKLIRKNIGISRYNDLQNHLNYICPLMENKLRYYFPEQYSSTKVKLLTLMYLEEFLGYGFFELNMANNNMLDERSFRKKCSSLKPLFKKIVSYINSKSLSRDIEHKPDWGEFNSYDFRFGKKFLGFTRRENRNQKFGTFCLHDDYSEESDPEGLMNLDY